MPSSVVNSGAQCSNSRARVLRVYEPTESPGRGPVSSTRSGLSATAWKASSSSRTVVPLPVPRLITSYDRSPPAGSTSSKCRSARTCACARSHTWMKSRMPEPSRVGQSVPVIANTSSFSSAVISLPSTWVGLAICSPVRIFGSAPIGLKYRSEIARRSVAAAVSSSTHSMTAFVRAYGERGSIAECSSTEKSSPGR
jgi:hypothetical protein